MDRSVLARKPMTELKDIAAHLELRGYQKLRKAELIEAIISSGADGGGEQPAPAGGQQQLVPDEAPAAARRTEETARKVLPPSARQADAGGGARGGEQAAAEQPSGRQAEGDGGGDDSRPARRRERTRDAEQARGGQGGDDQRGEQARGDQARGDQRGGDQAGGDRSRPARGRGDEADTDRSRGDKSRGEQPRDQGGADTARADQQGGGEQGRGQQDDDGDDDDGRTRRSRRDRRKRNRDRDDDQQQPAPTAPPSGNDPGEVRAGVLDILPEGYGFLRTTGYLPGERDVYVSQGQIRKHGMRRGDVVQGPIRQQRSNEKVPALHHVQRVNGEELEDGQVAPRPDFDELTPVRPDERIQLGGPDAPLVARAVDLLAPIGRGQRALLIAPSRSGKTALLRQIGQAVATASPDSHVMAVLVDERPEEITETARMLPGEVVASAFDQPAEEHAQIAELALERARRLVELGHDVVILLDSATRLARAHAVITQTQGRSIAPGVEAAALYPLKRFMAAARNTEEGGSLTVIATALTGTSSATDQVVLEELRRVANTVVALEPGLVARRVEAPVAVLTSGTDDEELLQDEGDLAIIRTLRRMLEQLPEEQASELLLDKLAQTDGAEALLEQLRAADPVG